MTQEEWNELDALRKAINDNPASVHPDKMEIFTSLFVKSLSYVDEKSLSYVDDVTEKKLSTCPNFLEG